MKRVALATLLVLFVLLVGAVMAEGSDPVANEIFLGTNAARASSHLSPLVYDPILSEIARGHSEEMLVNKYFNHDSPNQICKTVSDRLRFGHRFCLSSAENLHKCQGYERNRLAKLAISSWMESPGHRRNVLNSHFNRVGIGIAHKGNVYLFTQLFSYEPVILQSLEVEPQGAGYHVRIRALVADGPRVGGWFVDGKRHSDWVADPEGVISTDLVLSQAGNLEIGQLVGERSWEVETAIPIPPPEMHYRHNFQGDVLPLDRRL